MAATQFVCGKIFEITLDKLVDIKLFLMSI